MWSPLSTLFLALCATFLLTQPQPVAAQRRLNEDEMKGVINLKELRYNRGGSHECNYMEKAVDAYSGRSSGAGNEQFYLECCAGKQFPVCGGTSSNFRLRCCPGFVRFIDVDGISKCNQRVLSDREAFAWLNEFRADATIGLSGFLDAFVNTRQVAEVLLRDRPNNQTWTVLAVADGAFRASDISGFNSLNKCSSSNASSVGGFNSSATGGGKIIEGSPGHRELVYRQKCQGSDGSNATGDGTIDFTNEAWKHLISGRKYISDLQKEAIVYSKYKTKSGEQYPLKFSRYSSGVACIECAPIVEANHEASNAVIHIIGKSILSKSPAVSLADLVRVKFPDFWALMAEPERRLLGGNGGGGGACGAFYTVFAPSRIGDLRGLSEDQRTAAIREHIVKGLWCTAGMIDAETQPVATAAADSVKFACDASSRRLVRFGRSFSGQAVVSSSPGEFDIMATNGVVHVIDKPILPSEATPLVMALQVDSAELLEEQATEKLAIRLFKDCSVKFQDDKGYIVLLPTDEAFQKFFTHRGIPEAINFRDNLDVRCSILRHHILEAERDLTSLGRATHLQKTYRTLNGDRVADFLFVKNGVLKAYFMNAEVVHGADGHVFLNGHIYHTKEVILPPSSPIWTKMIDQMYGEQKSVIYRFRSLASRTSGGDRLMTLFLPRNDYDSLMNLENLRAHISDTVFYLTYLTGEVESIDLTALSGGRISIAREAGQYYVSSVGSFKKVLLHDCGVKLSVGIICSVDSPLVSSVTST